MTGVQILSECLTIEEVELFFDNLQNQRGALESVIYLKYWFISNREHLVIDGAFVWALTNEGQPYWKAVSDKIKNYYLTKNNNNERV